MKHGNFNGIEDKIATWEKKYPLADFINPEIVRKIKAILNKEFLTRLIGDCLAAKILHEREKQLESYKKLEEIIDSANKTKNYKKAIRDIQKWKEDLGSNGLSIYSFDRYYRPKICTLLLIPSKELKIQEEATQNLKELIEKGHSLDSKTFSQELTSWQDKYCIKNFSDKLQTEINEITSALLKSIHEKKQEEIAIEQLQTVLTSSSDVNPLDSIALILSQYDYTRFSDNAKKQIDSITQKAVSLNENLNINFDFAEEDMNTNSKNSTTTLQIKAISNLKNIFSSNPHDLEGILNWIYINRKISFTEFARDEIIKQFVSAGYKISPQASYSIPEINVNLTYQNFSKIDEIRMAVILNYIGILTQGNTISTSGKDNLEQIHCTSEQENLVEETKPSVSLIVPVYDNTPELSHTTEDQKYDESGSITENKKKDLVIVIEDLLNNPSATYEIPSPKSPEITSLSKEKSVISETEVSSEALLDNTPKKEKPFIEIPVYDTTDIILEEKEVSTPQKPSKETKQENTCNKSTKPPVSEEQNVSHKRLKSKKEDNNSINSSIAKKEQISTSPNVIIEENYSKTQSTSEEKELSSSYGLTLEEQENIEQIYKELSYITLVSPIISQVISCTSKIQQNKFEPEKNNDF